jgi:adenosine deaminase
VLRYEKGIAATGVPKRSPMKFDDIADAPIPFDRSFFEQLPKTDLHVHLDGSMRLETILDLAKKGNIDLGVTTRDALFDTIGVGKQHKSLEAYLKGFAITLKVLQTKEGLYRAAYELAEDAKQENIEYMEVRFSPILHTERRLAPTTILESVLAGLRDAERDFGIKSGVIVCGIRNISPQVSLRLAELAVAFKNRGVVGFDLAGSEYNYPAKDHLEAFSLILSNNVNVTIHAGEAYGPESIHQALHYCGAHRLGHGTRLREDGDLLNYVNDHRIPMEICVSSNTQTGAVHSLKEHPIKFYLDLGLRVTVNTDNRLITNTTMTDEYYLVYQQFDLMPREIMDLIMNGVKSSFIPYEYRKDFIKRTKSTVKALIVAHAEGSQQPDATT